MYYHPFHSFLSENAETQSHDCACFVKQRHKKNTLEVFTDYSSPKVREFVQDVPDILQSFAEKTNKFFDYALDLCRITEMQEMVRDDDGQEYEETILKVDYEGTDVEGEVCKFTLTLKIFGAGFELIKPQVDSRGNVFELITGYGRNPRTGQVVRYGGSPLVDTAYAEELREVSRALWEVAQEKTGLGFRSVAFTPKLKRDGVLTNTRFLINVPVSLQTNETLKSFVKTKNSNGYEGKYFDLAGLAELEFINPYADSFGSFSSLAA
jgi:hypothetical protein